MPGRKTVKTADASEVQGKDAFVKYQEPSNAEMRDFRIQTAEYQNRLQAFQEEGDTLSEEFNAVVEEAERYQANFLAQYIIDWNWVADDEGEIPLPKPHNNPDAFIDLLPTETAWLGTLFNVSIKKKLK